jgi:hypothetical protein
VLRFNISLSSPSQKKNHAHVESCSCVASERNNTVTFLSFSQFVHCSEKDKKLTKTLCIGNPEVYVNLEIHFYYSFCVYISLHFFHLEPFTFSYVAIFIFAVFFSETFFLPYLFFSETGS